MRLERHCRVAGRPIAPVILDAERDAARIGLDQAPVRDRDAVRVARQVGEHSLWAGERTLGILPIIRGAGRRFAIPIIRFMGSAFLSCARKTPTETDIFA